MEFKRLFSPIKINGLALKNRVVMTAIHLTYSDDGSANDKVKHFYWRRAEGGAAMLIVGGIASDNYVGYPNMLRLDKDEFIPSYREMNDGIHARGALSCALLMQTGRYGKAAFVEGDDSILSASAVLSQMSGDTPRAMTKEEIKTTCKRAGEAAIRAKTAGFDCVELTAASGYLISQFLSPLTNLREDEYGGSFENRCRFGLEMVAAVRKAVGGDFPFAVRVAGNQFMKGGTSLEECVEWCKLLENAGVNMLDVTGGWHETQIPQLPGDVPRGGFVYLAEAIKNAVSIPVLTANRHNDPVEAETVLALEQADIIGMCRTLIADPDWPKKAQTGQENTIRRCVACNQGCFANVFSYKPCKCLLNYYVGKEYLEEENTKTDSPKKLLVVGAGVGGCEFALRAAQRGHKVTLVEKGGRIGGQLELVSVPPAKHEFATITPYYETALCESGVQVWLNRELTAEDIRKGGYDGVVFATGSTVKKIPLPGNSSIPVYTAEEILSRQVIAGKNVVVVGGSSVGCETADYLVQEGSISEEKLHFLLSQNAEKGEKIAEMLHNSSRKVTVLDIAKIGSGFDFGCGWPVLKDLKRLGVKSLPFANILDITDHAVTIEAKDRKTGEVQQLSIPCDTIVLAVGYTSDNALYNELKDSDVPAYVIGNAKQAGNILSAIHQANELVSQM